MSRAEVEIYNEATGFVITSKSLAGRDLSEVEPSSDEWIALTQEGVFLPVQLVQDDGFNVRVIVDEPLSGDEEAQWVDHWAGTLLVPDGVLTISAGSEYLEGEEMEDYTEFVDVPPGAYRAELFTCIPGVNGWYCLGAAEGGDEPLGAYFRRTRPGERFPDWLFDDCVEEPEIDPGHEDEWMERETDYEVGAYVDFLLRLTRLAEGESGPAAPVETARDERNPRGWVPIAVAPRKPTRFPVGLLTEGGTPAKTPDAFA